MQRLLTARSKAFVARPGRWELKSLGSVEPGLRPPAGRVRDPSPHLYRSKIPRLFGTTISGGRRGEMKKSGKNIEKSRKAVESRPYTLQEAVPLCKR